MELLIREDNDSQAAQIMKIKRQFKIRYDRFVVKQARANNLRSMKLSWAILKAYVKLHKTEKHEDGLVQFCREKLEYFKLKRLFKNIKLHG
jgi:hypothetical protein